MRPPSFVNLTAFEQIPYDLLQAAGVTKNNVAVDVNHCGQGHPFHVSAWPDDINGSLKDAFDLDRLSVEFELPVMMREVSRMSSTNRVCDCALLQSPPSRVAPYAQRASRYAIAPNPESK